MEADIMIIGLQIIAILFAFTMIYLAALNYKREEISRVEMVGWIVVWFGTIVVVIFPEILQAFAKTFLFARVFDMAVVIAFILVISMVASAYVRTKRNEKKLEDLVRKLSLKKK
jgi:hypothetical protein